MVVSGMLRCRLALAGVLRTPVCWNGNARQLSAQALKAQLWDRREDRAVRRLTSTCNASANRSAAYSVVFHGCQDGTPALHCTDLTLPKLSDGEVLAKILVATICGSDLHTLFGRRKEATPR